MNLKREQPIVVIQPFLQHMLVLLLPTQFSKIIKIVELGGHRANIKMQGIFAHLTPQCLLIFRSCAGKYKHVKVNAVTLLRLGLSTESNYWLVNYLLTIDAWFSTPILYMCVCACVYLSCIYWLSQLTLDLFCSWYTQNKIPSDI